MINNQLTHYLSVTSSARLNDKVGQAVERSLVVILSK
jgi:hypothetical protein